MYIFETPTTRPANFCDRLLKKFTDQSRLNLEKTLRESRSENMEVSEIYSAFMSLEVSKLTNINSSRVSPQGASFIGENIFFWRKQQLLKKNGKTGDNELLLVICHNNLHLASITTNLA